VIKVTVHLRLRQHQSKKSESKENFLHLQSGKLSSKLFTNYSDKGMHAVEIISSLIVLKEKSGLI